MGIRSVGSWATALLTRSLDVMVSVFLMALSPFNSHFFNAAMQILKKLIF
jgi:hypothetical protein